MLLCYSLSHHPESKDLKLERAGQGDHTRPACQCSPRCLAAAGRASHASHTGLHPDIHSSATSLPCPTSVQGGSRGVLVKISGARDTEQGHHSHQPATLTPASRKMSEWLLGQGWSVAGREMRSNLPYFHRDQERDDDNNERSASGTQGPNTTDR